MKKSFMDTWKAQVGEVVMIRIEDGSCISGLLVKVSSVSKAYWSSDHDKNKWAFLSRHERWKTNSKKRKMISVSVLTGADIEHFFVTKEDILTLKFE
jgi:hypothetical protein